MKIVDLSAGHRAVWFNKSHKDVLFIDHREEVGPDIVADTRDLSDIRNGVYDLAVFDPPHANFGANSNMSKSYGHSTTSEIEDLIYWTAIEAWRITRAEALMSLKWNNRDISLSRVLALMEPWWSPLIGTVVQSRQRQSSFSRKSETQWVLLQKGA